MKKQINSCCKEKSIRNDVERKYLKISSRIYAGTCIVNPLSNIVASVIKFTVTYWFYVFSWVGKLNFAWHQKKKKKQLHNFRSCKTLQIQIGGLKTKHHPVHCLQRVVHYFKTVKNKSYSILFPQTNKETNVFKQIIDSFNGE